MESGAIADFQITASSAHDIGNVGPQHARYVCLLKKIFIYFNCKHKMVEKNQFLFKRGYL
jgi:hypothetical protein